MSIQILITLAAFLAGLELAQFITNLEWKQNSKVPVRLLKGKKFYKVIDINSRKSWKWADLHRHNKKEI